VIQARLVSEAVKGKPIFFPHEGREIQYRERWMLYKTLLMFIGKI
jgi:hypothetical protein